jgi:hypothetical protein
VRNEGNCVGSEVIAKMSIIAYTRRPVDVGGSRSRSDVMHACGVNMITDEMPRNPPGGSSLRFSESFGIMPSYGASRPCKSIQLNPQLY